MATIEGTSVLPMYSPFPRNDLVLFGRSPIDDTEPQQSQQISGESSWWHALETSQWWPVVVRTSNLEGEPEISLCIRTYCSSTCWCQLIDSWGLAWPRGSVHGDTMQLKRAVFNACFGHWNTFPTVIYKGNRWVPSACETDARVSAAKSTWLTPGKGAMISRIAMTKNTDFVLIFSLICRIMSYRFSFKFRKVRLRLDGRYWRDQPVHRLGKQNAHRIGTVLFNSVRVCVTQ